MPTRPPGHVLVKITAASLNRVDLYMRDSGVGITHSLPMVMGVDGAGMVAECDPEETRLRPGQPVLIYPALWCGRCPYCLRGDPVLCQSVRILGEHGDGTLAQYVSVPAANVVAVPETFSDAQAACLPVAYLTAWRMVVTKAAVKPTDTVLIFGIGGGVSLAALQICRLLGARVIVTSGHDRKLEQALALGADLALHHGRDDVVAMVMAATDKRGVDVVVENVGHATWDVAQRVVGRGGTIVTCGATSGGEVMTDLRRLFIRQISVLGSTLGNPGELLDLVQAVGRHRLLPVIDSTFALSDIHAALARLESAEQMGKIVVSLV